MAVQDIPLRDGKDGDSQLATLRRYLGDTQAPFKHQDTLLVSFLILRSPVDTWRQLVRAESWEVPFSFDIHSETNLSPITSIRLAIGDTEHDLMRYTDQYLCRILSIFPLRYVVRMLKLSEANVSTYPADVNHPVHIVRRYLGDTDTTSPTWTDSDILQLLLKSGQDPFTYVTSHLERSLGATLLDSGVSGNDLASVDGISFSSGQEALSLSLQDISYLKDQAAWSVYTKEAPYEFWQEGLEPENTLLQEWHRWDDTEDMESQADVMEGCKVLSGGSF